MNNVNCDKRQSPKLSTTTAEMIEIQWLPANESVQIIRRAKQKLLLFIGLYVGLSSQVNTYAQIMSQRTMRHILYQIDDFLQRIYRLGCALLQQTNIVQEHFQCRLIERTMSELF